MGKLVKILDMSHQISRPTTKLQDIEAKVTLFRREIAPQYIEYAENWYSYSLNPQYSNVDEEEVRGQETPENIFLSFNCTYSAFNAVFSIWKVDKSITKLPELRCIENLVRDMGDGATSLLSSLDSYSVEALLKTKIKDMEVYGKWRTHLGKPARSKKPLEPMSPECLMIYKLLERIYLIRCNVAHGTKQPSREEPIYCAISILREITLFAINMAKQMYCSPVSG